MSDFWRVVAVGAAAGAAGTAGLNATTFADMALRGRPASETPEHTVEKLVENSPFRVPGDADTRRNRIAGLAPLMGSLAGTAGGDAAALGVKHCAVRRGRPPARHRP